MRERAHGNWSIISGHAAEFVARDEGSLSARIGSTKRSNNSGRPTSNYQNVHHLLKYLPSPGSDAVLGLRVFSRAKAQRRKENPRNAVALCAFAPLPRKFFLNHCVAS